MSLSTTESGSSQLKLPPVTDLAYAPTLKTLLVEALDLGTGLDIDAGDVQRITAPCLQVLVAAAKSFGESGHSALTFSKVSPEFAGAAKTLAIDVMLGIQGD